MPSATNQNKKLLKMISVGLMAALVFVGNYMQIKIPVSIGDVTRVHLGNSMCLLAGLLFGPGIGGLASGIGAALYDLFDPVYIVSAPYTFCSKFAMGFVAGLLNRQFAGEERKYKPVGVIAAGIVGQLTYIFLYLLKSYVSLRLVGTASGAALIAVIPKIASSSINAIAAVIISVPLFFALKKALAHTGFMTLLNEKKEKSGWWNPVTVVLTAYCVVITLFGAMYLSSINKINSAQAEKEAAVAEQIEAIEQKLDYLAEEYDITFPEIETEAEAEE